MKIALVVLALFVAAEAQLFPWLGGQQNRGTPCDDDKDCKDDECCIYDPFENLLGKKKRFLSDLWGTNNGKIGTCKPSKVEGDFCSIFDNIIGGAGIHRFACPCAKGLECRPEDKHEEDGLVIHRNPICSVPEPGSGDEN